MRTRALSDYSSSYWYNYISKSNLYIRRLEDKLKTIGSQYAVVFTSEFVYKTNETDRFMYVHGAASKSV